MMFDLVLNMAFWVLFSIFSIFSIYIYRRQLGEYNIEQKMLYKSQPGQVVSSPHQNYKVTFTTSTRPIQANLNTPMSRSHQGYHQPYLNPQSITPNQNYVNPYGKQYKSTNLNKQLNGSSMYGQIKHQEREQKIKQESNSWLGNNWWKILLGLIVIGGVGFGAFMLLKRQNNNMGNDDSYEVSNNIVEDGKGNLSFIMPPIQNINQTSKIPYRNTLEIPSAPVSIKNKVQESKESSKITDKQEINTKQKQQVKILKKEEVNGTEKNEKMIQNIMPPQSKSGSVWEQNIQVKYEQKTQNKAENKQEIKSEIKSQIKLQPKQETKLEIIPKTKPVVKPIAQPETKPPTQPQIKLEIKTEAKAIPVTKPEDKNGLNNEVKIGITPVNESFEIKASQQKTQNKPANKSQQIYDKNELKPIPKVQIGQETRPEEKLQNKTEPTVQTKSKTQPLTNTTQKPEQEAEQILHPKVTQIDIKGGQKIMPRLSIKDGEQITIQSEFRNAEMVGKQGQKQKWKQREKMIGEQKGIQNKSHQLRKYK